MRVLVVDDDPGFTSDLMLVKPPDVILDVAHTSLEAFRLLRERTPDGVILDLTMPPVLAGDAAHEGLAVLGAILGGYSGEIPVVVATDTADADRSQWCSRLGAVQVLGKATGLGALYDAIRKAANERAQGVAPR